MSLGQKPRLITDFLIMFASAPAECGEQSKQRTQSPVCEWTKWCMQITSDYVCMISRKDTNALEMFENARLY